MKKGVSRRIVIAAAVLVAVAVAVGALAALSIFDDESRSVQGSGPRVLVLADDVGEFAQFDAIAKASNVASIDELNALTDQAPAVVLIDAAVAAELKSGDLRKVAHGGSAVIGLNVSLSQLNDLTGFEEELRSLNPLFAEKPTADPPSEGSFYSLVWRTPEGSNPAYWGRSQHSLSDGLFEAVINSYKLRVRGLIADGDRVVPLEQYGRE